MSTLEKSMQQRPELTAFVQEQLKQFDQYNLIDAENHGGRDKPSLSEQNIKPYLIGNHHKAQAIIGHVATELQAAILVSEVVENEKITQRKLQTLQNKLVAVKEKAVEFEKTLKDTQFEDGWFHPYLIWLCICIPLLGDSMLNRPAFETYGYSYIESLGISVLLAAALAVLAHCFSRIVALGKSVWQKRAIGAAIFLLITALFYYLADTRISYLSSEPDAANVHLSAVPIAAMSVLLFGVAVGLKHFFFPTTEQRKAIHEYQASKQQYDDNRAEQQCIEQEIETLKQKQEELRQVNSALYVYGGRLEDMIISHAYAGFATWQKVNMMHRTDNGRPLCFDHDEYPFAFQRNFKPIHHS
ncbi:hypothetical protein [Mucilaginibacter rubeus]|uniref:Uncharacterized protein n=1 Tax=Mucilaginibacter rubeus TaxID=2027860 RepID=A0A5C1I540_9SPHI|nr:hypothetical protein [Mucilaginibacter rubeus]QEM12976.1 hypothetical protein DEO27_024170 [Mucilaginibacter rubeus]